MNEDASGPTDFDERVREVLAGRPEPIAAHEYRLVTGDGSEFCIHGSMEPLVVGEILHMPPGRGTWRVVKIEEAVRPARFMGEMQGDAVIEPVDADA